MANSWITLVKKTFGEGRKKNKEYSYKQAMMDAKMIKNGSKKRGGGGEEMDKMDKMSEKDDGDVMEYGNAADVATAPMGGKPRKSKMGGKKSKKCKMSGKKSKKTRKSRK